VKVPIIIKAFSGGAAAGSASTAVMMPVQSAGNSLYFGDPFMSLKDYGLGIPAAAPPINASMMIGISTDCL